MDNATTYSIRIVKGEFLKATPLADKIIALDRKNMEPILRAVERDFPDRGRRVTLFYQTNQMSLAEHGEEVAGYVDFCDDLEDASAVYISSIQIEAAYRGGPLFKHLITNLLFQLRMRTFSAIKANIQKSNMQMIEIAKKADFKIIKNPKNSRDLILIAGREILDSPKLNRLFGLKEVFK